MAASPPLAPADADLRQRLLTPLAHVRQRCRLYLLLSGVRWLGLTLVITGLIQLGLDRWLRLSIDQRAALNVLITLVWLAIIYRKILLPLLRPLPDHLLARIVDQAYPELRDLFSTAVQLTPARHSARPTLSDSAIEEQSIAHSPQLIARVRQEAADAALRVPFLDVLDHRRALQHGGELLALIVLVALAFEFMPKPMGTWFARNWLLQELAWPQATYIWPDGFGSTRTRRMPRGEPVDLTATVRGEVPLHAFVEWWTDSGRRGREGLTLVGETQFAATLGALSEDLHFRIEGGDEHTAAFTIAAVERPRLTGVTAIITPPAYTQLPPVTLEQQTTLELLEGGVLELDAQISKPLRSAAFEHREGGVPGAVLAYDNTEAGATLAVYWQAPISGTYTFALLDQDGLEDRNPVRFIVRVTPDRSPSVQMALPNVGDVVTAAAELPVELDCRDDYGLSAVDLRLQLGDGEVSATPVLAEQFELVFAARQTVLVADAGVVPGDRLRVWAEAADIAPDGPNRTAAPPRLLRIVTPEEFLVELGRRELILRQEFERLVSAQRQLRVELVRLLDAWPDEMRLPSSAERRLADLSRTQSGQTARCRSVARDYERILAEMRINRVARSQEERRIGQLVIDPLLILADETLPAAAAAVEALRSDAGAAARSAAQQRQDQVLAQMEAILGNMLEWEGYREAVALLEEVISAQDEVREQTLEAMSQQLDHILDLEEPPAAPANR